MSVRVVRTVMVEAVLLLSVLPAHSALLELRHALTVRAVLFRIRTTSRAVIRAAQVSRARKARPQKRLASPVTTAELRPGAVRFALLATSARTLVLHQYRATRGLQLLLDRHRVHNAAQEQ